MFLSPASLGFSGLAPDGAEDYTALAAKDGAMEGVAQGKQVDEAQMPQGAASVSVHGSAGTSVSLAAPSLGAAVPTSSLVLNPPRCTNHSLNTYYATDHLGTVRFTKTIDETGTEVATSTHDYEPFGVEITPTDACDNTHKFTGHERDAETQNDYMHFRFFSASMGRFQKPDSNFDNPTSNPQGWNLYSYVKGNPVNFNDPTGHMGVYGLSAVMAFATDADNQSPLPPPDGGMTDAINTQVQAGKERNASDPSGDMGQDLENGMKAINSDASHGPAPGTGDATNKDAQQGSSTGRLDKDKMMDYMDKHAYKESQHQCGAAVRKGLQAGGLDTKGHPAEAGDYGPFLEKHGGTPVPDGNKNPQKGDIAVFEKNAKHEHGHVEAYDGKQWVSDFKQKNFSPYSSDTPPATVYRLPGKEDPGQ